VEGRTYGGAPPAFAHSARPVGRPHAGENRVIQKLSTEPPGLGGSSQLSRLWICGKSFSTPCGERPVRQPRARVIHALSPGEGRLSPEPGRFSTRMSTERQHGTPFHRREGIASRDVATGAVGNRGKTWGRSGGQPGDNPRPLCTTGAASTGPPSFSTAASPGDVDKKGPPTSTERGYPRYPQPLLLLPTRYSSALIEKQLGLRSVENVTGTRVRCLFGAFCLGCPWYASDCSSATRSVPPPVGPHACRRRTAS
jgi:hypothetical protein